MCPAGGRGGGGGRRSHRPCATRRDPPPTTRRRCPPPLPPRRPCTPGWVVAAAAAAAARHWRAGVCGGCSARGGCPAGADPPLPPPLHQSPSFPFSSFVRFLRTASFFCLHLSFLALACPCSPLLPVIGSSTFSRLPPPTPLPSRRCPPPAPAAGGGGPAMVPTPFPAVAAVVAAAAAAGAASGGRPLVWGGPESVKGRPLRPDPLQEEGGGAVLGWEWHG